MTIERIKDLAKTVRLTPLYGPLMEAISHLQKDNPYKAVQVIIRAYPAICDNAILRKIYNSSIQMIIGIKGVDGGDQDGGSAQKRRPQ